MNSTNRLKGDREETGVIFVMGTDLMGDALILIPEEIARADVLFNHTLYGTTTMGQVRAVPGVVEVIEEWMGDSWGEGVDPWEDLYGSPRDSLPDVSSLIPANRSTMKATIQTSSLRPNGRNNSHRKRSWKSSAPTNGSAAGPTTPPSVPWLPPEQADAIAKRLQELGCKVKHDQELIDGYVHVG